MSFLIAAAVITLALGGVLVLLGVVEGEVQALPEGGNDEL
jgi:hypothetical protein